MFYTFKSPYLLLFQLFLHFRNRLYFCFLPPHEGCGFGSRSRRSSIMRIRRRSGSVNLEKFASDFVVFCLDLGLVVNSSTSMSEPPSAGQQQQFLSEIPNSDSSRRSLADFYASCEQHQQRYDVTANNNNSLNNRSSSQHERSGGDFSYGGTEKSANQRAPHQSTYTDDSQIRMSSSFDVLHQQLEALPPSSVARSRPVETPLQQPQQQPRTSSNNILASESRFDDLLLLRGGVGGGGGCDNNRCELLSGSQQHHHHQQQQQASERSLVLTESRNFTLSPETTDCDSGSCSLESTSQRDVISV